MTSGSTHVEGALDPDQRIADARLGRLLADLRRPPGIVRRRRTRPVMGVYLWGAPGRGKTMLVDRIVGQLGTIAVVRWHFHEFFADLQCAVGRYAGQSDAIGRACRYVLGDGVRIVVFDEFHVHDPGTATLLIRLLRELRSRGVVLLITSNTVPEDLMADSVFRPVFAPGVALLREMADVVELAGHLDHRAGGAGGKLAGGFVTIPAGGALTFEQVCGRPVSAHDYLVEADRLSVGGWRITEIPPLDGCPSDWAVRFTHLVDVAADRGIPLWLTPSCPVVELLDSCGRVRDGARLRSRLSGLRCVMGVSGPGG